MNRKLQDCERFRGCRQYTLFRPFASLQAALFHATTLYVSPVSFRQHLEGGFRADTAAASMQVFAN